MLEEAKDMAMEQFAANLSGRKTSANLCTLRNYGTR